MTDVVLPGLEIKADVADVLRVVIGELLKPCAQAIARWRRDVVQVDAYKKWSEVLEILQEYEDHHARLFGRDDPGDPGSPHHVTPSSAGQLPYFFQWAKAHMEAGDYSTVLKSVEDHLIKMNSRHKSLLELLALFNDTTSGREKAMYARRLQKVAGKLSLLMLGDGVTKQHDIWCSGAYFYFSGADRQKDPWFALFTRRIKRVFVPLWDEDGNAYNELTFDPTDNGDFEKYLMAIGWHELVARNDSALDDFEEEG